MGEWRCSSTHSNPRNWMEVSYQLHSPGALLAGEEAPVPTVQEDEWDPDRLWGPLILLYSGYRQQSKDLKLMKVL
jgi:hypothetical protein